MKPDWRDDEDLSLQRVAVFALCMAAFTLYLTLAAFSTVVFPFAIVVFLAPFALVIMTSAPQGRASRKNLVMPLLYAGVAILPLWPVYIHLKVGPMPIITPPRLILYMLSAIWAVDMMTSPMRRAQFLAGLKSGGGVSVCVLGFFAVSALGAPFAEGRSMAIQELARQLIIWLVPFCFAVTYVRRPREFRVIILLLTLAAVANALIAIGEKASGRLLAEVLSPFIVGDAEWIQITKSQKIRDGVFRAQGAHTHPLSVAEFFAMFAPFAIIFALSAKRSLHRWAWTGALLVLLAGAVAASSRGAFLAIAVSFLATGVLLLLRFLRSGAAFRFEPVIGFAFLSLILIAPVGAVGAKKVIAGDGGASASRSSQARIEQIEMAWPKILKRPVFGYGSGRAARILGYWGRSLSIDNYYLTLALDLGFPGPILFVGVLVFSGAAAHRRMREGPPADQLLNLAFIASLIALATTRSILSLAGNLSFVYILVGAFVGVGACRSAGARKRQASPER